MFCKPKGEKCCIGDCANTDTNNHANTSPETNPYAGTYEFVGTYEYNTGNEECYKPNATGWTTATLTMDVTFEPLVVENPNFWDKVTIIATNATVDDSDFGTGASGSNLDRKMHTIIMPLVPREALDPANYGVVPISSEYPDGLRSDPLSKHGFAFYFPTGPEEWGTWITFGRESNGANFYVSDDGRAMHSTPFTSTDPFMTNNTWDARSQIGSGPLSLNSLIGAGKTEYCDPKFISWTFTKVSD